MVSYFILISKVPDPARSRFEVHGKILDIKSGNKGFTFIQFETEAAAKMAIEKEHGTQFNESKIKVDVARNGSL